MFYKLNFREYIPYTDIGLFVSQNTQGETFKTSFIHVLRTWINTYLANLTAALLAEPEGSVEELDWSQRFHRPDTGQRK